MVDKLSTYCLLHGLTLGIDTVKKNYPDRDWLVRMISYVSNGTDEIFLKDYVPNTSRYQDDRPEDQQMYVHNEDGLLDIPRSLVSTKSGGRTLNMAVLDAEHKLKAKLVMSE